MGRRVTGDRVQNAPRKELDRDNLDAVLVGGVLTDARAPDRAGAREETKSIAQVTNITAGQSLVAETNASPVLELFTTPVSSWTTLVLASIVPIDAVAVLLFARVYCAVDSGYTVASARLEMAAVGEESGSKVFVLRANPLNLVDAQENSSLLLVKLDSSYHCRYRWIFTGNPVNQFCNLYLAGYVTG